MGLFRWIFPADNVERGRIFVRPRWGGDDGMRHLLRVALPLIMSSALLSLNTFFDRTFLAWYSQDSFTAALQSGVTFWTCISLFHFTVVYASTFIAQFHGAGRNGEVGGMLWQGFYFALIGGVLLAALSPLTRPLFEWIGHSGDLPELEAAYFEVHCWCAGALLLNWSAQNFFTGLGRTGIVLVVNAATCGLNICLNTWMIFDPIWIFPAGIAGAAWASMIATFIGFLLFLLLILVNPDAERIYRVRSRWRFDREKFARLLRFGLPSGMQGLIDLIGITTFFLVVGMFGYRSQYASNLAMNANFLFWMPAIGIHAACQILSGQMCGAKKHHSVERMASGAATLTLVYMGLSLLLYLVFPEVILDWFRGGLGEGEWQEALSLAKLLLIFVACFTLTDALLLVYSGTLKGAGDTKFVMWVTMICSQIIITGPCILLGFYRDRFQDNNTGLYLAWLSLTLYIGFIGVLQLVRFRSGHWKTIEVIEGDGSQSVSDENVPPPPGDEIRPMASGV